MDEPQLRRAGTDPADALRLAELNAEVQALHSAHLPELFTPTGPEGLLAWATERVARPDTAVWFAEVGAVAVGYVLCVEVSRSATPFGPARRFVELDQIGVTPAARRRGIARRLIQRVLDEAAERGIGEVELSSYAFNTDAHAVFRAMGFAPRVVRFVRGAAGAR